jgi:hypothetical protein
MRGWVVAVFVAGCGRYGFSTIDTHDTTLDASLATLDATACTMPMVSDNFASGTPCSWGARNHVAIADESGGALHTTAPTPGTNQIANCSGTVAFDSGTFVEVDTVTTQATGYTALQMYFATTQIFMMYYADKAAIQVADETCPRNCIGEVPYDPVAARWWRLIPISSHQVAAEYGPDGLQWNRIGVKDVGSDSLASGFIVFGAGYYGTEMTASTSVFQHWNACP